MTLPPPSMKTFDISGSGVKIDVAAMEWPANATALVYEKGHGYEKGALVCRTKDPDESNQGTETSEIRIKCNADQVIGTSRNDEIRMMTNELRLYYAAQPHDVLHSSLSSFLLFLSSFSGDITQLNLPVGMQRVNFCNCKGLTGTAER